MKQFATAAFNLVFQMRFDRRPFVAVLSAAFILSVMQCAGCGLEFAKAQTSLIQITGDHGSVPDLPEQQLPCHSGHCLSHATAPDLLLTDYPVDLPLRAAALGREQSPAKLAGLPLFKPPRI